MYASYISANVFEVAADRTEEFVSNRRVKIFKGDDGIVYSTILGSVYILAKDATEVTIKYPVLGPSLESVLYGIVSSNSYGSLPNHAHSEEPGDGGKLSADDVVFTTISGMSSTNVQDAIAELYNMIVSLGG